MKKFGIIIGILVSLLLVGSIEYRRFMYEYDAENESSQEIEQEERGQEEGIAQEEGKDREETNQEEKNRKMESLLERLTGTWVNEDGRYTLTLDKDGRTILKLKEEIVLDATAEPIYYEIEGNQRLIFQLDDIGLKHEEVESKEGTRFGTVKSFYYDSTEGNWLFMKIEFENGVFEYRFPLE